MASPTRWTWLWASSGSWWWTGKPGALQSMVSQRVGLDWATELNWSLLKNGKTGSEGELWHFFYSNLPKLVHYSGFWNSSFTEIFLLNFEQGQIGPTWWLWTLPIHSSMCWPFVSLNQEPEFPVCSSKIGSEVQTELLGTQDLAVQTWFCCCLSVHLPGSQCRNQRTLDQKSALRLALHQTFAVIETLTSWIHFLTSSHRVN